MRHFDLIKKELDKTEKEISRLETKREILKQELQEAIDELTK